MTGCLGVGVVRFDYSNPYQVDTSRVLSHTLEGSVVYLKPIYKWYYGLFYQHTQSIHGESEVCSPLCLNDVMVSFDTTTPCIHCYYILLFCLYQHGMKAIWFCINGS